MATLSRTTPSRRAVRFLGLGLAVAVHAGCSRSENEGHNAQPATRSEWEREQETEKGVAQHPSTEREQEFLPSEAELGSARGKSEGESREFGGVQARGRRKGGGLSTGSRRMGRATGEGRTPPRGMVRGRGGEGSSQRLFDGLRKTGSGERLGSVELDTKDGKLGQSKNKRERDKDSKVKWKGLR